MIRQRHFYLPDTDKNQPEMRERALVGSGADKPPKSG